jgi:WD40 repeat protein
LSHHEQEITALVVTPDGERLISGSSDRRITAWNTVRGEVERTWQAHSNAPCSLVACPDGFHVISGGSDGTFAGESTVKVWDVRTGEIVRTIDDFNGAVSNVLLDPTGRYLVTRSPVIEYEYEVYAVALSADGKTLASGSKDKTITLWDIGSGEPITRLTDAKGAITAIAFADDGRWLIGSSTDHCTRVWCARSGRLLGCQTTTAIVTCILDRGHELWFGMSDGTIGVCRVASG